MAEFKEISPNAPLGAKVHNWCDNRFPTLFAESRKHMSEYYAPKNFNFWYFFGLFGALTASRKILFIQALPAALAFALLWLGR